MKKISFTLLAVVFSSLFTFTACAKEDAEPQQPNNEDPQQEQEDMTEQQQEIVAFLDSWAQAMVDRDVATLGSLMSDDLILVHITGATQTKQEWLDEIAAETMRYYSIRLENEVIEVSGNRASAVYISVLDARIWGSRNTWRLNVTMYMAKISGRWIRVNPPQ